MESMDSDPAFGNQWLQPRVPPGADIQSPTPWTNYPVPLAMNNFLWPGDVPAEPQDQRQLVVADDVWSADDVRNAEINHALRADPVWPLDIDHLVALGIAMPAGPQGQTVAGIPLNGITPHEGTSPAWPGFLYDQQLARGATMTEPGSQSPGVANNGVTLRSPPCKLPSENPSAIAPGCYLQKALPEVGAGSAASKALTEAPRKRRKPSVRRTGVRRVEPATEHVCEECTKSRGQLVTFNCRKDLWRHKRTTKAHNARAVVYCSCGTGVTRRDAMSSHHRSCEGVIVGQRGPRRSGTN